MIVIVPPNGFKYILVADLNTKSVENIAVSDGVRGSSYSEMKNKELQATAGCTPPNSRPVHRHVWLSFAVHRHVVCSNKTDQCCKWLAGSLSEMTAHCLIFPQIRCDLHLVPPWKLTGKHQWHALKLNISKMCFTSQNTSGFLFKIFFYASSTNINQQKCSGFI